MKDKNSNSWFIYAAKTLEKYDLPSIYDLIEDPVSKEKWKQIVKSAVNAKWIGIIKLQAKGKSSMKYISDDQYKAGRVHFIWQDVSDDTLAVKKAGIKAKLISGGYQLQENIFKQNKKIEKARCKLCNQEDEDIYHFILGCAVLSEVRKNFMEKIYSLLESKGLKNFYKINQRLMLQLILDVKSPLTPLQLHNEHDTHEIESISRGLIYALHSRRMALLKDE
ncbi:hypothetical protein FSP39_015891 [Pinctada imbricata]|uniref:Reverse transcriptase zinc-binding domain-containing protein n=1 Tax=Pinctada imbricata TaxID=66713 RepID=A0AA88XSP2_PINIB|nr:hypothetical protein FSP39_015891 [Pinctada imbricata]